MQHHGLQDAFFRGPAALHRAGRHRASGSGSACSAASGFKRDHHPAGSRSCSRATRSRRPRSSTASSASTSTLSKRRPRRPRQAGAVLLRRPARRRGRRRPSTTPTLEDFDDEVPQPQLVHSTARHPAPVPAHRRVLLVPALEHAGRRQQASCSSASRRRSSSRKETPEGHLRRRRRRRRGRSKSSHEIKDFLKDPAQLPGRRRPHPEGRAAVRPSRNRQDPARPRRRR